MNRAGAGPWSDALEVVSGAGAPDPPSAPVAEVVKMSGVRLKWDCPINNGAVISEYILEMAVLESRKSVASSSASTSAASSPAGSPLKQRNNQAVIDVSRSGSDCSEDEEDEDDSDEEDEACDDEESLVSQHLFLSNFYFFYQLASYSQIWLKIRYFQNR